MANEREAIQNALQLLRDTCANHSCRDCPLSTNGLNCKVQDQPPCEYNINPRTIAVWRAFSDGRAEDEDDDIAACNRESAGDNYW